MSSSPAPPGPRRFRRPVLERQCVGASARRVCTKLDDLQIGYGVLSASVCLDQQLHLHCAARMQQSAMWQSSGRIQHIGNPASQGEPLHGYRDS